MEPLPLLGGIPSPAGGTTPVAGGGTRTGWGRQCGRRGSHSPCLVGEYPHRPGGRLRRCGIPPEMIVIPGEMASVSPRILPIPSGRMAVSPGMMAVSWEMAGVSSGMKAVSGGRMAVSQGMKAVPRRMVSIPDWMPTVSGGGATVPCGRCRSGAAAPPPWKPPVDNPSPSLRLSPGNQHHSRTVLLLGHGRVGA